MLEDCHGSRVVKRHPEDKLQTIMLKYTNTAHFGFLLVHINLYHNLSNSDNIDIFVMFFGCKDLAFQFIMTLRTYIGNTMLPSTRSFYEQWHPGHVEKCSGISFVLLLGLKAILIHFGFESLLGAQCPCELRS